MSERVAEERRGLLVRDANDHAPQFKSRQDRQSFTLFHPVACCLVLYFLVEMYDMISTTPLTAVLEQTLCREYYKKNDPSLIAPGDFMNERLCKLDSVQSELAIVRGWSLAFDALPGSNILSVPAAWADAIKYYLSLFLLAKWRTVRVVK